MKTDREKLINWIKNTYVSNSRCAYKATVDDIADAVIADCLIDNGVVVREKGEWEWFEEWLPNTPDHPAECKDCGWRCGRCKAALADVVGGYWDNPDEKPELDFCPNCGADMRGNKNV